ncbi:hypothetical protein BOQ62_06140 [Chryseobacterium sp. CH21]|nr:hypothetical protein BOQ62_06140 [Chryseobacterium sp. CH21]
MIKSILIFILFLIYNPFHSQYFPFKNENKFDTITYKRIRDSLIAHPEKIHHRQCRKRVFFMIGRMEQTLS